MTEGWMPVNHKVTQQPDRLVETEGKYLKLYLDNGHLLVKTLAELYPLPLSGRETLKLLNMLIVNRDEIQAVALAEMKDEEKKKRANSASKKSKFVNGVEAVEISDLEKEYNGEDEE